MRNFIIISFYVVLMTSVGCGHATADMRRSQARASAVVKFENEITDQIRNEPPADRSENLVKHITGMEGVDRASVIITGNTAIIGISLAGELEGYTDRRLMRLKSRIKKEALMIDPELRHVAVTATGEFMERLNNLADPLGADDSPPRIDPSIERVINELTPPF